MLYVAFSGGADSTALAILLHQQGKDFEMVFADTGTELPETYYTVTRVSGVLGKKLTVVSNGSLFQHLVAFGFMLPSPFARWCTRVLKQVPQQRYFGEGCTVAVGIRADESHRNGAGMAGKNGTVVRPLVEAGITRSEAHALCAKYDLLNAAYSWRFRIGCWCCPFQRVHEWRGLLTHHPELFALAEQWEEEHRRRTSSSFTWIRGKTLSQLRTASIQQTLSWVEPEEEPCSVCAS